MSRRTTSVGGTESVSSHVKEALPDYLDASSVRRTDSVDLARNVEAWRQRADRSEAAVAEMADRLGRLQWVRNWLMDEIDQDQRLDEFPPTPGADPVPVPGDEDDRSTNTAEEFPPLSAGAAMNQNDDEEDDDFPPLSV
jgi:hypothetical protein